MRDFDSILQIIDSTISPNYLNSTQEIVLREVWNGKTYARIADDYNYDSEYIKTVGYNLWQILSDAFNEQINKSNFVPFMRRQASFIVGNSRRGQGVIDSSNSDKSEEQKCYWNTAPGTDFFWGREREIELLKSWNQELECHCVVISGIVGAGKTSLATKFSRDIQDTWDYVIWYSLDNPPPVTKLITYYLKLIDTDFVETLTESPDNLSLLISQFIQDLKKHKILIVLDGLENLLTIDKKKSSIFYKKEFEGYGQLIRSIISAHHQSLLVCTTQVVPRSFRYYQAEQMKLLEIGGLCDLSVKKHIDESAFTSVVASSKLLQIYNCVGNNPRLMNIVKKNLYMCEEQENLNLLLNELSSLEETIALLEKEIEYLSNSQKEIIYWLSTSSSSVCLKELLIYSELSKTKLKFMQDLDLLEKKSLIVRQDSLLSLMPIVKNYLRRKLIYQSFHRIK